MCYVLFLALFIAVSPNPNFLGILLLIFFLTYVFYEWTWLPFLSKSLFEKQRKFFKNQVTLIFKQDEIVEICAYQELKLRWFYKHIVGFAYGKSFYWGRRQETGDRRQELGEFRRGKSKNCLSIFLP